MIWEKHIQDLCYSENHPKDIAIEAEEELDEDDKEPTILKTCKERRPGDDNIPVDLLKELGGSGLKITTALDNMSRDWPPKDFLDVTMIALPKKNQAKKCSYSLQTCVE
jgi:hypothetical protein